MKRIDLTSKRFGSWTVLSCVGLRKRRLYWLAQCECGTERSIDSRVLREGFSQSCGCQTSELVRQRHTKHGHAGCPPSPSYRTWQGMIDRCFNPANKRYKDYGARGIAVCERWRKFENFLTDMRIRPEGKTLDRIDPDYNYEPTNCRWATIKEQRNNRRSDKKRDSSSVVKTRMSLPNGSGSSMNRPAPLYG